jgi:hypothetical protein
VCAIIDGYERKVDERRKRTHLLSKPIHPQELLRRQPPHLPSRVLLDNHRRFVEEGRMIRREDRGMPALKRDVAVPPGYTGVAVEVIFAGHDENEREERERGGEGGFGARGRPWSCR